jgi:hypothetical protein
MSRSKSTKQTSNTASFTSLVPAFQLRQENLLRLDGEEAGHGIDKLMSGVAFNNQRHRMSLFYGIEAEENLETFTFKSDPSFIVEPDNLPSGVEWVRINPATSIATLIKKFGDRLVFAAGEHRERTVTVLLWEVISKDERALRVLVRTAS